MYGDPKLVRPADPATWGRVLDGWERRAKRAPEAENERRWGDTETQALVIPAASVAPVEATIVQLVDVRTPARTWALSLSLQWLNPADGAFAPDTLDANFIVEYGVGSAKVNRFVTLSVVATAPVSVSDTVIEALPAATIVVAARLRVVPAAGAARTYRGRIASLAAPLTRGGW